MVILMFFYPCLQLSLSLANVGDIAILAVDFVNHIVIQEYFILVFMSPDKSSKIVKKAISRYIIRFIYSGRYKFRYIVNVW